MSGFTCAGERVILQARCLSNIFCTRVAELKDSNRDKQTSRELDKTKVVGNCGYLLSIFSVQIFSVVEISQLSKI